MVENRKTPEIRFDGFDDDWREQKFDDVAFVIDGDRGVNYPSGDDFHEQGHTLFLNAANVTKEGFSFELTQYITESKSDALGNGKLQVDDVVLTSRGSLGHVAWYSNQVQNQIPFARINSGMLILRSKSIIKPCFMAQLLKSPIGKKQIDLLSFGSAQPQLTKRDVSNQNISLPVNTDEQEMIGDFHQSIDNAIALAKQQHKKILNIKKAMLEKMFPKKSATVPEIRFEGFTGDWVMYSFFDTISRTIDFRGRTPRKLGMDWSETGYLALSALNVKDGYIDFSADANYGGEELYQKWMTGNELRKGQVLFTTEAPMGNVAQVPDNRKYILSQRTVAFNLNEKIITDDFMATLLRTDIVFYALTALSSGGTAKGVSQKSMEQLTLVVPSDIDEQVAIGNFFRNLDDFINAQGQEIEKLQNIKNACLNKMFV